MKMLPVVILAVSFERAVDCFGTSQLERATRFQMSQLVRATRCPTPNSHDDAQL